MAEEVWVIDRFEGDTAILESDSRSNIQVPRSALPKEVKEGDALNVVRMSVDPRHWTFALNPEDTKRRLRDAESILDELANRDPGGDIQL